MSQLGANATKSLLRTGISSMTGVSVVTVMVAVTMHEAVGSCGPLKAFCLMSPFIGCSPNDMCEWSQEWGLPQGSRASAPQSREEGLQCVIGPQGPTVGSSHFFTK